MSAHGRRTDPNGAPGPAHEGWTALLDRFERDLAADEPTAAWTPPAEPLPPSLAGRARRIAVAQDERMLRLGADLERTREHLDALRRVPAVRTDAPAYLDVDG